MDGGSYVLLGNLYAAARRFNGVKAIREMLLQNGIYKPPGCSIIEIDDVTYEFVASDKSVLKSQEIYMVLDELSIKLKMAGYVPMLAQHERGFRQ